MSRWTKSIVAMAALGLVLGTAGKVLAQDDPYETYVKTSKDFKAVKQDKNWALKAFPSWIFMPWYAQWPIGFNDAAGKFQVDNGMNGAFTNRGGSGRLDYINKFKLSFYMDHTAGKGDLHQWDSAPTNYMDQLHGTGVRIKPLNAAMEDRLKGIIKKSINEVKASPHRSAYALDDEISWGHFVHPTMWNATDDKEAYPAWLKEVYGAANAPKPDKWYSYNDIRGKLPTWTVAEFDASPLMDQWTFNDSYWNNLLGNLVEYANSVDPATPCGFVGGQSPNAFGGYDYAKVMRKVQYLEAYNAGDSQSICRSLSPRNALPLVTTFFYRSVADTNWQTWFYLANGNRGEIGWVEGWFDAGEDKALGLSNTPKPWIAQVAPQWKEAGQKIGPLMTGAEWIHDGVALYYSHASIQMSWIMDAEAHGATWINRNNDHKIGTSHLVRHGWINMLNDEGIQFNWISYADVIQNGVPKEYKVLILPAVFCLSEAEAKKIKEFVNNGGTVIADFMPGLWDQHGKGRAAGGVLDDLFGVKHDSGMKAADVFGSKLWCETDQDENFGYKDYAVLLTKNNDSIKDASGFDKAVRKMDVIKVNKVGKGTAVLMNLSPQWYNAYRVLGVKDAARRETFVKPVKDAGAKAWVRIKDAGQKEFGYQVTYWKKDGRTILFVVCAPEVAVTSEGGGNAVGLTTDKLPITLEFVGEIKNVRDERAGKDLGSGKEFKLTWPKNEAVVLSFDGAPPAGK